MNQQALEQDLVDRVVAGEKDAVRQFVARLTPLFVREAGVILWRSRRHVGGYTSKQDRDDLIQHVFEVFLTDPAHLLRSWKPELGTLDGFIAAFARNQMISRLRSRRQTAPNESPQAPEKLSSLLYTTGEEGWLAARQELLILVRLCGQVLEDRELELFERHYFEAQSSEQICSEMGLTPDAFYQAKSRLKKKLAELRDKDFKAKVAGADRETRRPARGSARP